MGYTHYWDRQRILPVKLFTLAVNDCQKVCSALPIPLGDADGEGKPVFNTRRIAFNGHRDSGKLSSLQSGEGLIWPAEQARGIAGVGEDDAMTGRGWGGGPIARGRILGPDGDGMYESFIVERIRKPRYRDEQSKPGGWWFDFTKTNYRPYDLCVQCCLLILSHHLGCRLFQVSSDGASSQWNEARDVCQHLLGYGIDWGEGTLSVCRADAPADRD